MLLSICGTPIIFYGDEFGFSNDVLYYEETKKITLIDDKRYLNRGKINWELVERDLENPNSYAYLIWNTLRNQIMTRNLYQQFFSSQNIIVKDVITDQLGECASQILAYIRALEDEEVSDRLLMLFNLKECKCSVRVPYSFVNARAEGQNETRKAIGSCLLGRPIIITCKNDAEYLELEEYGYHWMLVKNGRIHLG